jgi:hypothetical protein
LSQKTKYSQLEMRFDGNYSNVSPPSSLEWEFLMDEMALWKSKTQRIRCFVPCHLFNHSIIEKISHWKQNGLDTFIQWVILIQSTVDWNQFINNLHSYKTLPIHALQFDLTQSLFELCSNLSQFFQMIKAIGIPIQWVVPKLGSLEQYTNHLINVDWKELTSHLTQQSVLGAPPCYLSSGKPFILLPSQNFYKDNGQFNDTDFSLYYLDYFITEKRLSCVHCQHNASCEGIHRNILRDRGLKSLIPS